MDDGATKQERYLGKGEFGNGIGGDCFIWTGWVGILKTLIK